MAEAIKPITARELLDITSPLESIGLSDRPPEKYARKDGGEIFDAFVGEIERLSGGEPSELELPFGENEERIEVAVIANYKVHQREPGEQAVWDHGPYHTLRVVRPFHESARGPLHQTVAFNALKIGWTRHQASHLGYAFEERELVTGETRPEQLEWIQVRDGDRGDGLGRTEPGQFAESLRTDLARKDKIILGIGVEILKLLDPSMAGNPNTAGEADLARSHG